MKNDIMKLLRWRRKAKSATLAQFIKHYMGQWTFSVDAYGNLYTRVGTAPILWSCHLDTVHRKEGWQNVRIDNHGHIRQKGTKSRCLGADDGAGIWLLLEMLAEGVEGLYVFHLDEEVGGKGSAWITKYNKPFAEGIKYAVAFDRKGTKSIITNQWGVCCSDEFGKSLADEIGMDHELDTTGRFTDTDNYKDIVPECTNVSVGYYNEHTPREYLDYGYLQRLRDAMCRVNVENLVVQRDPDRYSYSRNSTYDYRTGRYSDDSYWDNYNSSVYEAQEEAKRKREAREKAQKELDDVPTIIKPKPGMGIVCVEDMRQTTIENVERVCSLNSRKLARLFIDAGATYNDVLTGFLDLDVRKANVATEDANKDGWLSMIAKYVLGGK